MTAPRTCGRCGAHLDAGEVCSCMNEEHTEPVAQGSMEFVMGNSLEQLPATIDFNFEQLKVELASSLAAYTGLVVTEDSIKGAKEDRARLNKLRDALETKRKEVKKQCMAPYNDFEAKVKELVGLIDQPIAAIDGQLQQFEEARRKAKLEDVRAVYEDTVGELRGLLPFEKVWRDEWYNVGATMKKVREAIVALEAKVASDLEALSVVEGEFIDAVKVKYLEDLDLRSALNEHKRLQAEAEKLRAYNARQEAMRKLEAAAPPKQEEPVPDGGYGTWEPGGGASVETPQPVPEEEKVYLLRFEAKVTKAQAAGLAEYLKDHNIDFRRI